MHTRTEGVECFIPIYQPIQLAGANIHQKTVYRDFGTYERTASHNFCCFDDILAFTAEQPEVLVEIIRQEMALHPKTPQSIDQLHRCCLGDLTVCMTDDRDFLGPFHGASHCQGPC